MSRRWTGVYIIAALGLLGAWPTTTSAELHADTSVDALTRHCRRAEAPSPSRPSARRLWARWMPNLRLRARFSPDSDRTTSHGRRGRRPVPFSYGRSLSNDTGLTTEIAAFWDITELMRPVAGDVRRIERVQCRYLQRLRRRRALSGPQPDRRETSNNSHEELE